MVHRIRVQPSERLQDSATCGLLISQDVLCIKNPRLCDSTHLDRWQQQDMAPAGDLRKQAVYAFVTRRQQPIGRSKLQLHPQHGSLPLRVQQAVQPQPVDAACRCSDRQ